jgi:hypothetical protein
MVSLEDYPEASVLYMELEIPTGINPTLVPNLASSSLMELGDRRVSPDFFAKPKQPERTDFSPYLKNRASR